MRLVLDATPLIHLTKAGFPFERFKMITTEGVLKEIFVADFPENAAISNMLEYKLLKVENPKDILKGTGIHRGELSIISLAKETNSICVIDDKIGRAFAEGLKIKTVYSAALIVEVLKKKIVTKHEAKNFVDKMIANGWRCDVATYGEILAKIEGIK